MSDLPFSLSSLKKMQSKPLVKGSKYQTLPGKLPRPSQNGDQGTYNASNSPDTCGVNDSEDNSILGLSMCPCLSERRRRGYVRGKQEN